jgi:glucosyl-dolichyl phosphate glucuronosyltransferase
MPELTVDVVICTKNREQDLRKALRSLAGQTVVPDNTIIADASNTNGTKKLAEDFAKKNGPLRITYIKCPVAGSTFQRNCGIAFCKHDIVFFMDDDVILEPDCIEEALRIYRQYPLCGGVSGNILNQHAHSFFYTLFKFVFFLPYYSSRTTNKLRYSGFPKVTTAQKGVTKSSFMEGTFCSFKRLILDRYKFDENLKRYAFFEDVDLSYRVSKEYVLMRTPSAKLNHYPSRTDRISRKELREVLTFNHFYLFCKNIKKNPVTIIAHVWSHIGLMIEAVIAVAVKRDISYISGMVSGWGRIIKYAASRFKSGFKKT